MSCNIMGENIQNQKFALGSMAVWKVLLEYMEANSHSKPKVRHQEKLSLGIPRVLRGKTMQSWQELASAIVCTLDTIYIQCAHYAPHC